MISKYSGLHAMTCAMRSSLLTYDDYNKLACSMSVSDFLDQLGQREAYKEAVSEAIEHGVNRMTAERSLMRSVYHDFASLYSFMTDMNDRKYFDVYFMKYEVELIKNLLRRLKDNRKLSNVFPKYDEFLKKHFQIDTEKLSACTNLTDAIQSLEQTEFHAVLTKIIKDNPTLFDYETQLDLYSYMKRHDFQSKYLDKESRETQVRINGSDADIHNITMIHRAKAYYDISNDYVYSLLIPINYRLRRDDIKKLNDSEDHDSFMQVLEKTPYKGIFRADASLSLEQACQAYMCDIYKDEQRKHPYSIQSAVSYIYFKSLEIQNLVTLIECVRYNITVENAMQKIYTVPSKAGGHK